jgi:hypothetical protein
MKALAALAAFSLAAPSQSWAQSMDCAHHAAVAERGDQVMGFDHEKTTHHFRLAKSGGTISVTANDAKDGESRDAIRGHLTHIAEMFREGNQYRRAEGELHAVAQRRWQPHRVRVLRRSDGPES